MVIPQAIPPGEGKESPDDRDPAPGYREHCICCDRRDRPVQSGMDDMESGFPLGRHYLLLCHHVSDRVVDQDLERDLQD